MKSKYKKVYRGIEANGRFSSFDSLFINNKLIMNYLSKRIRKLNKIKTKKQSTQLTINPDDPEEFCVSIANFNYTID